MIAERIERIDHEEMRGDDVAAVEGTVETGIAGNVAVVSETVVFMIGQLYYQI